MKGDYGCSAASDPQRHWTGVRSAETEIRISVGNNGAVSIESDPAPFDLHALGRMGLAVDDLGRTGGATASRDGRILTYGEDESNALHRMFEEGKAVTATLVFSSAAEPVTLTFGLDGYQLSAAQYKGCRGLLLNNEGWFGMHMTNAAPDAVWLRWVRENTTYRGPGILVVTVDPRKEAQKNDLRPGDIIVGCNGTDADVSALIRALKKLGPGESLVLDVVRDQAKGSRTITKPGERPLKEKRRP
ncbi:MAG: PDZ domain-containing protein [Nitrospiraceae bacterium]|nr:PDZ domain-containing protein [Nitrospiraceae bacterium]